MHFSQAQIYKADFEAERRDREQAHGRMEEEKGCIVDEMQLLRTTIQQKMRELQQKDRQLASLRGDRGTNTRQLSQLREETEKRVSSLQEDLQTAHAQIRGYKTRSDLLKKDLEVEKRKLAEESQQRVGIQEERDVLKGKVSEI